MPEVELSVDQQAALRVLRAYRRSRADLLGALRVLDGVLPQTKIAQESGLSRDGIRKMLARRRTPSTS